jgi:hypothetical protein
MNINAAFQWECQPQAERLILDVVDRALQANAFIAELQKELLKKTSTRLFDWVDHIVIRSTEELKEELQSSGFKLQGSEADHHVYYHPGAQLPRIVIKDIDDPVIGLAVSVESIANFLMVRGGLKTQIEGTSLGGYRRCYINAEQGVSLWVVERRGTLTIEPTLEEAGYVEKYICCREGWQNRLRDLEDEDRAMQQTISVAQDLVDVLGKDRAAWIVLECEREYWQARNTAGQLQKNRQDRLGMGWANHDHHTFRSSRRLFPQLVLLFEILGFRCRERFYAGKEAGWGAQVMENPTCRLVLFLDVDLAPDEIEQDIAHQTLPELPELGTIGLWCALHGDSILKGGMHHLEAQFMFDELTQALVGMGIKMMNPFSSFPYLKQAFTAGEIWPVDANRVRKLVEEGKITPEQGKKFLTEGALGSHLENLQRREGYKGFNQKNVSLIIKKTDPRLQG